MQRTGSDYLERHYGRVWSGGAKTLLLFANTSINIKFVHSKNAIQHNIDPGPKVALKWQEPMLLKMAICSGRKDTRKSAHYEPPDFLKQAPEL